MSNPACSAAKRAAKSVKALNVDEMYFFMVRLPFQSIGVSQLEPGERPATGQDGRERQNDKGDDE